MRVTSSDTTPVKPSAPSLRTPPTTLEPPPNGIAAKPLEPHQSSTAATSDSSVGKATKSGGLR